jgi:hypothetical protein
LYQQKIKIMKKTISHSFLLAATFIAVLLFGCGKDISTSTEQPLTALFADNAISDVSLNDTFINSANYEFGFEFEVSKNGKVTQLGTHNPDAGNIRVSLWDLADTSIIAQSTITVIANMPNFVALGSPVSLTTGKKYAITMQSNDWYEKSRTAFANYTYPIIKGNIKITKYGYSNGTFTPAKYPDNFETDYLAGIADFTYETED